MALPVATVSVFLTARFAVVMRKVFRWSSEKPTVKKSLAVATKNAPDGIHFQQAR